MPRARDLLRRSAPALPAFAIRCICGERIQGVREADYQVVSCPRCGNGVFVLPASPLPTLAPSPARGRGRKRKRSAESDPSGVGWGDRLAGLSRAAAEGTRRLVPPRRWFSTPRLVIAAVVLLVAGTAYWQVVQARLRSLRESVVPDGRRGLQALADGDLAAAREILARVDQAIRRLGETFPDGPRFQQAHAELDILDKLLPISLDDALREASLSSSRTDDAIRGKAIVLDAEVSRDPSGTYRIGYVAFMDGEPVRIDPGPMALFEKLGARGRARLLFGAKLEGLDRQGGRWRIRLDPHSGVLLTERRVALALGLAGEADIAERLRDQRQLLDELAEQTAAPSPSAAKE